jgi:rhodanese-related sulfurtransferase/CBS domain-containing protein
VNGVKVVDLDGARELIQRGAQLVEVLPAREYGELHLPGAVNHPLKELDALRAQQLDRASPVVVYCWDALCDLSPRAAAWLGQLGFEAYDYALGKVDWMAHGLPLEGSAADEPSAASFLRDDVATCALDDSGVEVGRRIEQSPYGFALVLADGVVIGRVRRSLLAEAPRDATAGLVMDIGPTTTRPHRKPEEVAARLRAADAGVAIITTPEGRLLGVVRAADLEADAG